MSTTTLLLYSKATGTVLSAATVAAAPDGEISATQLAGDAFPARYFSALPSTPLSVSVPSDELAVLAVDSAVVPVDQAFTRLVDLGDKSPGSLDDTRTISVDANASSSGLKVTFTPGAVGKTTVWMRAEPVETNGTPAQTLTAQPNVTTAGSAMSVQMPVQNFQSGTYRALTMIPGCVPSLSTFTVS